LLALRAAHPALQTGIDQNLFADEDVFEFVRTRDDPGCTSDHSSDRSKERLLIVLNMAQQSKTLDLPVIETALAGCTEFQATAPAKVAAPVVRGEKLYVEEPAESMTAFEARRMQPAAMRRRFMHRLRGCSIENGALSPKYP
jgi:hypothetical protein